MRHTDHGRQRDERRGNDAVDHAAHGPQPSSNQQPSGGPQPSGNQRPNSEREADVVHQVDQAILRRRIGLCSVTFRQLTADEVIAAAVGAGLECIEWGGDIHVPTGDTARAEDAARRTADAGLTVASYGSYWRADEDITPVLDSAAALGADRVRIWAGRIGSAEATEVERHAITDAIAEASASARDLGITLALEYHSGTIADTPDAVRRLLDDVPGLRTYWQPTVGAPDEVALHEYDLLRDAVAAVHVFSWWPTTQRLRLAQRESLWSPLFRTAAEPRDALLEFVPHDDPDLLALEAATLRKWISQW